MILENEIVSKLLEFEEDTTAIVSLVFLIYIVAHVFILENLHRLQEGISSSQVNFPEKKRITILKMYR
jgi:Cu+-exporting ATPase